MSIHKSKARETRSGWYIRCPVCKTRIALDECPVPGGLNCNIEVCCECGADIEVQPTSGANEIVCAKRRGT